MQALRDPSGITSRQRQVVELIAQGLSNDEVGVALGISPRTAKAHCDVLRQKLGVPRRRQIPVAFRLLTGEDPLANKLASARANAGGLTAKKRPRRHPRPRALQPPVQARREGVRLPFSELHVRERECRHPQVATNRGAPGGNSASSNARGSSSCWMSLTRRQSCSSRRPAMARQRSRVNGRSRSMAPFGSAPPQPTATSRTLPEDLARGIDDLGGDAIEVHRRVPPRSW